MCEGECGNDWSSLETERRNIDLLLAFNPQSDKEDVPQAHIIPPPTDCNTVTHKLTTRHRNCAEIETVARFIEQHRDKLPDTAPMLPHDQLPSGRVPVWIERGEEVTDVEVLERVKRQHVKEGERVMVVYDHKKPVTETRDWCGGQQPAWRYVGIVDIRGCEDQVVVWIHTGSAPENYSRARNGLVVVSTTSQPR